MEIPPPFPCLRFGIRLGELEENVGWKEVDTGRLGGIRGDFWECSDPEVCWKAPERELSLGEGR